jgi:molybdate transport system permease protein
LIRIGKSGSVSNLVSPVTVSAYLSPSEIDALYLSLKVALVATLWTLPPGIAIAFVLARFKFPGHAILNGLVHLPLVMPPVVTGYLLLVGFGRNGIIGHALDACCGIVFAFRWTGAALAAAVMAFPLVVRAIRLSIEAVDKRLEDSARNLGAPPLTVFMRITLPLAAPGLIAGAVIGFAKALGEFGATITFVSSIPGETQTIPSAIYALIQTPAGDGPAFKLVLVSIAISFVGLLVSEALARRVARP